MPSEREHLLQVCRSVMPGVAGVVLATMTGGVIAHEERVRDPARLATRAATERETATSALLSDAGGLYLVVFVPSPLVDQLASCEPGALAAS